MKLRNKNDREIIEYSISLNQWSEDDQEWYLFGNYDSIDELKEEWEDYEPKEPLIKDERIRKAVRAWAEAVGVDKVIYQDISEHYVYFRTELDEYEHTICINFWHKLDADLCSGTTYTIAELCGEEKE